MKTAVIYARYSSERQTEQSIEGQLRVCNEYAERNDIVVVDTYIDRAMTGTNDNRKDFQRMLRDSAKKVWDYVLVYKLDRFSRNKYETAMHKRELRDNGIKLLSAMENIPDSPEGIILESLLEGMAEYYSAELSQKVKRGLNESRIKGNFTGGHLVYGYKVENKKILIDEEKAEIVRYIYEEYAKEVPVKDIIDSLNNRGVKNRGKPFARNTIYHTLANKKYIGVYQFEGQEFLNIYPRIVPQELFNLVDSRNKNNHYGKRSLDVSYLLRDKLFCGYCGKPMTAETGTAKSGEVHRYYKCSGRKLHNGCTKLQVRKKTIEDYVVQKTIDLLSEQNAIQDIADKVMACLDTDNTDKATLYYLQKEQKKVQSQIENFLEAIGNGLSTMSTKIKLEALEQELAQLEIKITATATKTKLNLTRNDIIHQLTSSLHKDPRQMILSLVNKIVLYDDKIEIHFKYTNKKNPDDNSQGFLYRQINSQPVKSTANNKAKFVEMSLSIYFE